MRRQKTTSLNTTGKKLVGLRDGRTMMCRQKVHDFIPVKVSKKCEGWFCGLSKEERLFRKARDEFDDEADIISILKKIRRLESWYATMERKQRMPLIEDQNLVGGFKIVTTDSSSFASDFSGSDLDDEVEIKDSDDSVFKDKKSSRSSSSSSSGKNKRKNKLSLSRLLND